MPFDIQSVAIIGGGPGGIASVYELTHTNKDGTTTVGSGKSTDPKFAKIVGFEQKLCCGGTWTPAFEHKGLGTPPQLVFDTENYDDPSIISPSYEPPEGIEKALVDNPVKTEFNQEARDLQWRHSALYEDLYTNVPSRFTRFSYMDYPDKYKDTKRTIYPFMSQTELCSSIRTFVDKEGIEDYYRFDSRIESVYKNDNGKWVLVVKKIVDGDHEEWYQEEFDAVVVAIGHFTVPVYPKTKGLAEFNKNFPGVVTHAFGYREHDDYKDKNVLMIGGSISTVNALQYVTSIAKSVTVASRGKHPLFDWINGAIRSDGITNKPPISNIDPVTGVITFEDGTTGSGYDKILFTTGYHYWFPFLKNQYKLTNKGSPKVNDVYLHTFWMEDPTLATIGVTGSTLLFTSLEHSAALIAGIWSNAKTLPPKEEQKEWANNRQKYVEENGGSYQYYHHRKIHPLLIEKSTKYYPLNRKDPLHEDFEHLDDVDTGIANIEKIFYGIKSNKLSVKDTLY